MRYSILLLLEERHEDFARYVEGLHRVFALLPADFEILILANGLGGFLRGSWERIHRGRPEIKGLVLNRKATQAACLEAGLRESRGEIIVVLGSYRQITEGSLLRMIESLDSRTDLVTPWRRRRVDPFFSRWQSRVFNGLARLLTGCPWNDLSATMRVIRREVLEKTTLYGNLYRFLPVLAERKGFRVKEVECEHAEERGPRLGGLSAYLTRAVDLGTLFFNVRFPKKPLRLFSLLGLGFCLAGLVLIVYVLAEKVLQGAGIGARPAFLGGILLLLLGLQVASAGLLGELIVFTHGRKMRDYVVEKEI